MLTVDFLAAGGWIVLGVVVLAAIVAGILVGTPVIRMRGDYLAIVTLGFGEIVRILFLSDWLSPTFGGAQGVRQIPAAKLDVLDVTITGINPKSIFYIVMVFVAIAIYVSWRLSKSRIGRAWAAMREDESVAAAMGIDTVRAKLLAFVAGAILASFGGMIFAIKVGSVFPNSFELLVSIIVLVVVIVGGMGNIPGVIVGALVLIGVLGGPTQPGVLAEFAEFKLLIYGAILVYMMLQRLEGLLPSVRRSRELHQEEFLQDAWIVSTQVADETAEATR
jgi:branched-chain amino acid transport system permease protein